MLQQLTTCPKTNELRILFHIQTCMVGDTKKGNVNVLLVLWGFFYGGVK